MLLTLRICCDFVKSFVGKQDLPAENDSAKPKPTVRRSGRSKTTRCVKPLEGKERNAAHQKARGFKSKHPFFKVVIQSSYACDRSLVSLNFKIFFIPIFLTQQSLVHYYPFNLSVFS